MRCVLATAGGLLLRGAGILLRRRFCSGPLLLLGVAVCVFYQTLMVARNRVRSGPQQQQPETDEDLMETRKFISAVEALQRETQVQLLSHHRRAIVLTGRLLPSDSEVQLYQQVLQQIEYEVQMSRYAETSSFLRTQQGVGGWSLLLCLSSSEHSCLRRISFTHLQRHQMVNLIPELMQAFSDAGGGLCWFVTQRSGADLPIRSHSCGTTNQKLQDPQHSRAQVEPYALVAVVNVYVVVTSLSPLTSFLHDVSVVTTSQQQKGRPVKLRDFLQQQLGPTASHQALGQVKKVIGEVLLAASTNEKPRHISRCLLCFQLLTFTLYFSGSLTPVIVQVHTEFTFTALSEDTFDRQITKDLILDDTLRFLLPRTPLSMNAYLSSQSEGGQYGGCRWTRGICLSEHDFLLLSLFQQQMKTPSPFQLLYPSVSSSSSLSLGASDLLIRIGRYYELQANNSCRTEETDALTSQQSAFSSSQDEENGTTPRVCPLKVDPADFLGACLDPHLRQIYTEPPLTLTPPFSPWVKEYRTEVTFDTVTVRIRPEPVSTACSVHLDEHRGPRMANYPVGLGHSRISILVTDDAEPEPTVVTIYSVHVVRENRPSLPMFGDHVMCSFMQDCGLLVQPTRSCGLQPHIMSQHPVQTCSSGHVPGRWVVPCLSCSDNRTCDWRRISWHPDGCYHPLVDGPLLQDCMRDRKVMFIGDSTNRGMMYFLMERVNSSLEDWGKAHDMLVYGNLNGGRTLVSYSYYPRFWLDKKQRPTFRQALLQLLHRSQPLVNSIRTVLVVGGVQWLNTNHLRTVVEVLDRKSLRNILVVVKSLGMGFHLPVDGIRSLSLTEIQDLSRENDDIIATAEHHGYEAIDTFSITMGRYKEFLQGRCACHFHEVEKSWSKANRTRPEPELSSQSAMLGTDQEAGSHPPTYHVRGPVNQVYSEILLSRLCPRN